MVATGERRARAATALVFFLTGVVGGTWSARIPAVQERLNLSDGALGVALLGLEGAISDAERRRFEAHLGECDFCVEYLDQMRHIAGDLRGLSGETIGAERREALLSAFRQLHV